MRQCVNQCDLVKQALLIRVGFGPALNPTGLIQPVESLVVQELQLALRCAAIGWGKRLDQAQVGNVFVDFEQSLLAVGAGGGVNVVDGGNVFVGRLFRVR